MAKRKAAYGNDSISALKGADRVRKKPAVIFGSDGIEGCQHSVFEIITNSIDEAREGFGKKIIITRYADHSIEVQDFGRGAPVDFNTKENCYNWELLYCELYAGSKYDNAKDGTYQFSLGTNGLGLCSTQYASEYMDVEIKRDGYKYTLHFEKGENSPISMCRFPILKTRCAGRRSSTRVYCLFCVIRSVPSLKQRNTFIKTGLRIMSMKLPKRTGCALCNFGKGSEKAEIVRTDRNI